MDQKIRTPSAPVLKPIEERRESEINNQRVCITLCDQILSDLGQKQQRGYFLARADRRTRRLIEENLWQLNSFSGQWIEWGVRQPFVETTNTLGQIEGDVFRLRHNLVKLAATNYAWRRFLQTVAVKRRAANEPEGPSERVA